MWGDYPVVVLDPVNVLSGIYPLFDMATGAAEVAGYRDAVEVPKPHPDIVSNTGRAGITGDFDDFARLALGAFVRVLHGALPDNAE
jgi:hypothetical protein